MNTCEQDNEPSGSTEGRKFILTTRFRVSYFKVIINKWHNESLKAEDTRFSFCVKILVYVKKNTHSIQYKEIGRLHTA
jgi:hypothetical protein